MTTLIDEVSAFLDLESAPFTLMGSRILVLRDGDAVTIRVAEYERPLADCVIADHLRVRDSEGTALHVSAVFPDRIEFGGGTVTATFAGVAALSFGGSADSWSIEFEAGSDIETSNKVGGANRVLWEPELPTAARAACVAMGALTTSIAGKRSVVIALAGSASEVQIAVGENPVQQAGHHLEHLSATRDQWLTWFEHCPRVRPDLRAMTAFCWWVLGANTVDLVGRGDAKAVVPSKIGYVGLWQWDAYFIAVGLRHGAPELARTQLELAFGYPTKNGQLPDVVHDEGVLASSDDLPPQDRVNLRRAGSAIADPSAPIPLTKPPLAAWALRKVLETVDDDEWANLAWETIARSQEWWFEHSDLDHDGMPEYGHPYSSGLDDSPIFDHELPVASPDLAAYLIVQDDELARHFRATGDYGRADRHAARAESTLTRLEQLWDPAAGYFRARASGHPVNEYTVVSLLPLLTGRLPGPIVTTLLDALDDESQFATPFAVPTVARRDSAFSAERMWRGPVWINVNALLVDGLLVSGQVERSRALAERTVELVIHAGGPHEYFNPLTGERAHTATTSFGWSAALFIDLAVGLSD
jgi:Glycosyl hydrolase family 63 C-terminal domain